MAKKRQLSVISEQSSASSGQSPVSNEQLYTVGLWANLPQYVCSKCGYDTLEAGVMREHLFWQHSEIVEIEGAKPPSAEAAFPQMPEEHGNLGEENDQSVFEIELDEIGSIVDEQGNEHKTFTVKEQ